MKKHRDVEQKNMREIYIQFSDGNISKAQQLALEFVRKHHTNAFGWKVLGLIYKRQGDLKNALSATLKSIKFESQDPESFNNLSSIYLSQKNFTEAKKNALQAIKLKKNFSTAYLNLSLSLIGLGFLADAEVYCRKSVSLNPNLAQGYFSLGNIFSITGRHSDAEVSYREAIRLDPNFSEAHNNLGNILREAGNLTDAYKSYQVSYGLDLKNVEAINNLGNILKELGYLEDARSKFQEALNVRPYFPEANSNLLLTLNYINECQAAEIFTESTNFGRKVSKACNPKFSNFNLDPKPKKLRIGFVSGDFREHPVGFFLENLLLNLKHNEFEFIAFPTNNKVDSLTERLKFFFNSWIPIFGKEDADAAKVVFFSNVQILIDLSGHTADNRLPVFSFRPAPVQVSWLGYFATTGIPEIDFFLGDPIMSPPSDQQYFSETIWNLKNCWFTRSPYVNTKIADEFPYVKNGYITYGSFANLSKVNLNVIEIWSQILCLNPSSRLIFKSNQLSDSNVVKNIQASFMERGIASDRLNLQSASEKSTYLQSYNQVDLVLDTFPFPGGTTTVDALLMGVPVLTLVGNRFLSRFGESILRSANLADWVAVDEADYVKKAVNAKQEIAAIASSRIKFRADIVKSDLCKSGEFADNFAKTLKEMWAYRVNNND